MGKCKEHVHKHLVSAKEWMSRAEQSFEKEKNIRGELDLFLAQAELARAKEAGRLYRLVQYPLFKQSAALIVAVAAVTLGLGANYWFNAHTPAQPAGIVASGKELPSNYSIAKLDGALFDKEQPAFIVHSDNSLPTHSAQAQAPKLPNKTPGQPPVLAEETTAKPVAVAREHLAPQPERSYSPAPVAVSREQMQNLIRSAGNSLRGRD